MAGLLEKRIPVDGREETQAEHAIADRDLIGGLAALFAAEDLVRVGAPLGQLVFEMVEGFDRGPLVAEQLEQADDERITQVRERGR